MIVVANIIVLLAVCHVKYVEKLGAFLSVAVSKVPNAYCRIKWLTGHVVPDYNDSGPTPCPIDTKYVHIPTTSLPKWNQFKSSISGFNDSASTSYTSSRDPVSAPRPPIHVKGFQSSDSGKARPKSLMVRGGGQQNPTDTFELGVRIQTETHMDGGDELGARTVDLHRVESLSSTGASGKGVPAQYDPERGFDHDDDDTRHYDRDVKPRWASFSFHAGLFYRFLDSGIHSSINDYHRSFIPLVSQLVCLSRLQFIYTESHFLVHPTPFVV
jgi:hypothetical protein